MQIHYSKYVFVISLKYRSQFSIELIFQDFKFYNESRTISTKISHAFIHANINFSLLRHRINGRAICIVQALRGMLSRYTRQEEKIFFVKKKSAFSANPMYSFTKERLQIKPQLT